MCPLGNHVDEDNKTDTLSLYEPTTDFSDFEDPSEDPSEDFVLSKDVELPKEACAYCGISSPACVAKCNICNKWFCNNKTTGSGSHIITHLITSKHNSISLHEDSDLGDTTLECYNCGNRNVFVLGFVSAKADSVVVILCRLPCAQAKDINWDTDEWQSLIENRQLLPWVAHIPNEEEAMNARTISPSQISKLEGKWRLNKEATLEDVTKPEEEEEEIIPILMRYTDAFQYQRSFAPLVQLEADYDRQLKESQALEHISVIWGMGLNNKHLASFSLSTYETSEVKVAVGDEMILRYTGFELDKEWEATGFIIRLPSSLQEEFTLELRPDAELPPTHLTTNFTAEFVWKGTSYDRMQDAMKDFALDNKSVSAYIYHKLLGKEVVPIEFDIKLPKIFSIPKLAELNVSQANAVRNVLQRPLSLIQGPPGTGKTVTSATIVYHLSKMNTGKILVCAPSNVAVDHLAAKLGTLGLKVVRLVGRSREDVDSSVSELALHEIVKKGAKGELKKFLRLKEELGELSSRDSHKFISLIRKSEKTILQDAEVICCTCVGAGDQRLQNMKFRTVLIDESTQASEPECLIPIVKGAKQVILVGDHQQLGPVILNKKAGDAGLRQSLFERLIFLGHIPIRLEVQYRMNPCLSEFPSNIFYDGSLQNGVTSEQRTITESMFPWPIRETPMMFWAVYGREEISGSGTSFLNRIETMNCERIITRLFKDGIKPSQIGVITPYEGQRAYVVQYMQMNGTLPDKSLYMDVEVASVDAFQGREKDFIILSCVRANDQQTIGFLKDPRRLNVALTRAKYGLIILGNPKSLSKNPLWNHLLVHFREKGCLVEGHLDNLQLSSVQLSRVLPNNSETGMRSNYSRNVPSSYASSERSYDVESLVSYDAAPSSRRQNNSHQQYASSSYGGNNRNNYISNNNWQTFSQTYGGESDSVIQSVSGRSEASDYYDHRMNKFFQSNSFGNIGMGGYQQQQQVPQQQQQQQQQYGGSGNQKFDNDIAKLTNSFSNQFTF